jgi:hypothetical protein
LNFNQPKSKMGKRGGARPGAGRKKGSRTRRTDKTIGSIAELAKQHTDTALNALVDVATRSESDAARVSAATAILDRGYGKPAQPHTGESGGNLVVKILNIGTGDFAPSLLAPQRLSNGRLGGMENGHQKVIAHLAPESGEG